MLKGEKIKKITGVVLVFVLAFVLFTGYYEAKADTVLPKIAFVGIEHSPLIVGDTETFLITAKQADKVQYRIYLYTQSKDNGKDNPWEELTTGYTASMNANKPFEFKPSKVFEYGKYKLYIYAKRSDKDGVNSDKNCSFDSRYIVNLNCVNKDSNRVYVNDSMDIQKDSYKVEEKIVINGIKNISGMQGPYFYKLHIYNASTDVWTNNITNYTDKIEWTPKEAGTYVIDVWAISDNSSLWKKEKQLNGKIYEAWKLKVITVTNEDGTTVPPADNGGTVTPPAPGGSGTVSDLKIENAGFVISSSGSITLTKTAENTYYYDLSNQNNEDHITYISFTPSKSCTVTMNIPSIGVKAFPGNANTPVMIKIPVDFGFPDNPPEGVGMHNFRAYCDSNGIFTYTATLKDSSNNSVTVTVNLKVK